MIKHAGGHLVTVVMVSYYTGPILFQAIDAVLAGAAPVELILVNNGNPAEVEATLAKRAKAEPRLQLLTGHGNVGFSHACNLGAAKGKGDYLLFLHPDCLLPKDAIPTLLDHAGRLSRPFMIGARLVDAQGKDQPGARRTLLSPRGAFVDLLRLQSHFPQDKFDLHRDPIPHSLEPVPAISGAFMFVQRDDFIHVHGFDEGYFWHGGDMDLCLRFRRAKGEIYFAPEIVVRRQGSGSAAGFVTTERSKARGLVRYFHENFGHDHFQPILWALYVVIWARFIVRILLPHARHHAKKLETVAKNVKAKRK